MTPPTLFQRLKPGILEQDNKNHENSKHQIPNPKQIPMIQIQKSKQRIIPPLRQTASSLARQILHSRALQFLCMFLVIEY